MDEIKIEDLPEDKMDNSLPSEEIKIEKVSEEKEIQKSVPIKFIYMVAAIIIIFIGLLSFGAIKSYFGPTGQVVTVNDLFLKNLQGELKADQGYIYNGFSFVFFDGLWYTEVQIQDIIFQVPLHFGPKDLEDIPITGQLDERFNQGDIYLTFNPLTSDDFLGVAIGEISQSVARAIHRMPIAACDQNETAACHSRPIIDCTNTDSAVIYFVQEPGPSIELNGNCLVIKGQEYDIVKAADRVLMRWYQVMD